MTLEATKHSVAGHKTFIYLSFFFFLVVVSFGLGFLFLFYFKIIFRFVCNTH